MSDKMDAYEKALKEKEGLFAKGVQRKASEKGLGIKISGSGIISDEEIRVSGSSRLPGGIKVKALHVSGSALIDGDITAKEMKISGSFSAKGTVKAHKLEVSGSFDAKELKGGSAKISGSCSVEGQVTLEDFLKASGSIAVKGDLHAERSIFLAGEFDVKGMLKTGDLKVKLNKSDCHVNGGIKARNVEVTRGKSELGFFILKLKKRRSGCLYTPFIRALDRVYVENVICNEISGRDVEIGDGCEVNGPIRYSRTFKVASTARVAKKPIKCKV